MSTGVASSEGALALLAYETWEHTPNSGQYLPAAYCQGSIHMSGYGARGQPHAMAGHRPMGIGKLCPDSREESNPGCAEAWGTAPLAVSTAGNLA